ncbi:DsrE family protein [Algibacter mikhailovii]|uniref:DsrE family protein n=1 Tax=Algibacter mikhailovii TaxID=425498 RepID=UPI0024945D4B|nr:DsrE family protein [Algibacter mikhailovii]
MTNTKQLIVTLSVNANDDVSTVAFTVANAAISKGMTVGVFLTSNAVELSREGACEYTHVQPFKKLNDLMASFTANGGTLWACAPCFNNHGLNTEETIDGTVVTGAGPMLDWIANGAQTLAF